MKFKIGILQLLPLQCPFIVSFLSNLTEKPNQNETTGTFSTPTWHKHTHLCSVGFLLVILIWLKAGKKSPPCQYY